MALTERLQILIEAIGGPAGATFNKLGKDAQVAYGQITKGSREAEVNASRFGNVAKAAALAGGTALAVGLVGGIKSAVEHFVELADRTRELEHLTGASAEKSSEFAAVLGFLGVSTESVSKGLGIFADHLARTPQLFASLGVEIVKTSDGNNDLLGTLENVRKKIHETTDATVADSTAKQLLGRSYQSLLPYLHLTNEQLDLFKRLARQSGQILSQGDVDRARELKIQVQEIKNQFDAVKLSAGRAFANLTSNFLKGVDVLSKVNIRDVLHLDFSGARDEAAAQSDVARTLAETQVGAQEAATAQQNLDSAEKSVASSAKNLRAAQDSLAQAHRAVQTATEGVTKAQQGLQKAHLQVQRADENLADAEENLNELLRKGDIDYKKLAEAEQNLASASLGAQRAQESLADAQAHLNEVLAGATPDELTDAQLALERATIGVAQAQRGVNDAHKAKAGRDPLDEAAAELSLREALQSQTEAQERLDAVKAKGTAQDKDVISAQRQVRDAAQAVADAINSQNTAAAALREAQAGDPDFEKKVAAAKREVRDATYAMRDAEDAEADAAKAVKDAHQGVIDAKARDEDASYHLRDAQYALSDGMQAAADAGADQLQIITDLIGLYPELQGVLANYQAQLAQPDPRLAYQGRDTYGGGNRPGPSLPPYDDGGWVTGPPGAPAGIVHGGEFVISRSMMAAASGRSGGSSRAVANFYFPNYVGNKAELIDTVHRGLLQKYKGGVPWARRG